MALTVAEVGTGQLISGGDVSLSFGTAPSSGSLVVAAVIRDNQYTLTAPPGWTLWGTGWVALATDATRECALYYKIADGSGTKAFVWSVSTGSMIGVTGLRISGNAAAPADIPTENSGSQAEGNPSPISMSAGTAPAQNDVIHVVASACKYTQTGPMTGEAWAGSFTVAEATLETTGGTKWALHLGYLIVADGAAADPDFSWTGGPTNVGGTVMTMAFKQAAVLAASPVAA